MPNVGVVFSASTILVATCCLGLAQNAPVVGAAPEDIMVISQHAPEIHLHDVVFVECRIDEPNVCQPKIRAKLSDSDTKQWQALEFLIVVSLKDGTGKLVETQYDGGGTIYANPDNLYRAEDVKAYKIRFVSGMRLETQEVNSYEGPVAKDLGCYRDMQKAQAREGLARRKALVELLEYGCVVVTPEVMQVTTSVPVRGNPALWRVNLSGSVAMSGIVKRADVVKIPMLLPKYYFQ